jgi:hypothetical protein
MKRKIKTQKTKAKKPKVQKVKVTKVKVDKPAKVLFKYKKSDKSAETKITGHHYYSETLATDEHGDPLVTQNTAMHGDKVIQTMIYDMKNDVVIFKNHE